MSDVNTEATYLLYFKSNKPMQKEWRHAVTYRTLCNT